MAKLNLKAIIPTTLGTVLEWAEYTFFAYMADHLSTLFFPIDNPELARLKTYGIFATSYFMRPIGALLFGNLGDHLGRKPALIGSMILMCVATTTIGLLPTYVQLGSFAAVLLILCRLLQGIAVAGEFSGSAVFIFEHSSDRPFLPGAFTPFAAAAGMSIGALSATLVSLPNAPEYAWRIPFLCSSLIGLIALYLRLKTTETPAFEEYTATQPNLKRSFNLKDNGMALVSTAAMALFISLYVYIGNIYYKTLCINIGDLDPYLASKIITLGQVLTALLILSFGWIADQTNGKKLCLMGLGLSIFLSPFILACAQSGDIVMTITGQIFYAFLNGMVSAPMMTLLLEQFSPSVRYRGQSLAWNLVTAVFGGTALMAAEYLLSHYGSRSLSMYVSFGAILAFITLAFSKTKEQVSLNVPTSEVYS